MWYLVMALVILVETIDLFVCRGENDSLREQNERLSKENLEMRSRISVMRMWGDE